MSDTTDEPDQEASAEAESCAQAGPTPTKCPKCGSKRVVDTGTGQEKCTLPIRELRITTNAKGVITGLH